VYYRPACKWHEFVIWITKTWMHGVYSVKHFYIALSTCVWRKNMTWDSSTNRFTLTRNVTPMDGCDIPGREMTKESIDSRCVLLMRFSNIKYSFLSVCRSYIIDNIVYVLSTFSLRPSHRLFPKLQITWRFCRPIKREVENFS